MSLQHSGRKYETHWVGVDTRLLGKPGEFSGAQDAWRDCSAVFRRYAGAAVPRLQKLIVEAAKAGATIPNATILEEDDRAASAQLHWMMLMICTGAALNIVFPAGDREGLEAWRQLTEKYEPKMRTRFAGQLMSVLSFSLQGDTAERITAWAREIATYERDSGKVLDDENQDWNVSAQVARITAENHLLMRVDTVKKGTGFRSEAVAIARAISATQTLPTPMDIGAVGKGTSSKRWQGSQSNAASMFQGVETRITLQQTVLTPTRRAVHVERSVIWHVRVDLLELRSSRQRVETRRAREARVQAQPRRVVIVARVGICHPSVSRRRPMRWKS